MTRLDPLAISRGLIEARSLAIPNRISFGLDLSLAKFRGVLDYRRNVGSFSVFAQGFGGMTLDPYYGWKPDLGLIGGLGWDW